MVKVYCVSSRYTCLNNVVYFSGVVYPLRTIGQAPAPSSSNATQVDIPAYMNHVRRPGFIQPAGTLLLFDFTAHKVRPLTFSTLRVE